jgi:hypothetical protein
MSERRDHLRAVFVVAWPVWATPYPGPDAVLRDLENNRHLLLTTMSDAVNPSPEASATGGVQLNIERFEASGYTPIQGLRASEHDGPANSVRLRVHVDALGRRQQLSDIEAAAILRCLADTIRTFITRDKGGANLYDVTTRWGWGQEPETRELEEEERTAESPDGNNNVEVWHEIVWDGRNESQSTVAHVNLLLRDIQPPSNAYDEAVKSSVMRDAESFLNGMMAQRQQIHPQSLQHLIVKCTRINYSSIFFGFDYIVIGGAAYMMIKDYPDLRQGIIEMTNDLRAAGGAIEKFILRAFGISTQ